MTILFSELFHSGLEDGPGRVQGRFDFIPGLKGLSNQRIPETVGATNKQAEDECDQGNDGVNKRYEDEAVQLETVGEHHCSVGDQEMTEEVAG